MRLVLLLTLCWASTAQAEWSFVETFTDPFDGFETKAATRQNSDGASLHLYRNPVGRVMALFTLPDGSTLPASGLVATITPQGFKSKEITANTEQGRIVEYARTDGPMLRDRLWHGEGQVPVGTLADMLKAPRLSAAFTLSDGTTLNTGWSMDTSGLPLARALGLTLDGVPAGAAWEDAASQAMLAAMTACQFPSLDIACVQKVTACSPHISDARDIDAFDTCVAKDG